MEKDNFKTTVIFRKDKSNKYADNITAVFPYLVQGGSVPLMECYAHVGQHGSCSYDWYLQDTKPAKPDEYASLKRELEDNYGYDLDIKQKINADKFREAVKDFRVKFMTEHFKAS